MTALGAMFGLHGHFAFQTEQEVTSPSPPNNCPIPAEDRGPL